MQGPNSPEPGNSQIELLKLSWPLQILLLIAFVVMFADLIWRMARTDFRGQENLSSLSLKYSEIPLPDGSRLSSEIQRFNGGSHQWVSASYESSLDWRALENHFYQELSRNGWQAIQYGKYYPSRELRTSCFFLNDLAAIIDV
jgi:hypothetical protein